MPKVMMQPEPLWGANVAHYLPHRTKEAYNVYKVEVSRLSAGGDKGSEVRL